MPPSLDIIIVNWNAGLQLAQCISSLAVARRDDLDLQRVVVVDNASRDDSLDNIATSHAPLTVVRNDRNRGFAAACNQGARGSHADYLLFLNPDTRLYAESLTRPVRFLEAPENRTVGIAGVQLVDRLGHVSRTSARFPTAPRFIAKMFGIDRLWPRRFPPHFMVEWDHQSTREVDQVMGAFFLVRRSLFEELDGFDERFFVYFEEVDFSLRARARGWRTMFLSDAQAFHRGGGVSEQVKAARLFYSLRSRLLYACKHFSRLGATGVTLGTLFVEPFARLAAAAARGSGPEIGATIVAYAALFGGLVEMVRRPRQPGEEFRGPFS
jgi:GT2 family glycosyltransferase